MKELKVLEDIIGLKFQYYNTIKNIEENSTIQIAAPKVGTTEDTNTKGATGSKDIGDITGSGPDTVMGVIILNKYNIIIIYNKNEIKFYNINNIINTLQFNNLLFKLYFNNIINIITSETVLAHTATEVLPGTNTLITNAVVPSTVTEGKGANFTGIECTSEKNPNEIAAVTRSGESSTFSMDTNSKGTEDIEVDPFRAVGEVDPLGATVGPSTVTEDTATDNILIELENELILYNIKKLKIILKYKKMKKKLYKYKLINNLLIIIYENKLKIYKINQLIFFHQFNFNITFLSNFFQNFFILIDQYNHLYYLEISNTVLGHTESTVVPGTSNSTEVSTTEVTNINSTTNNLTTTNTNTNSTNESTIGPSTVTEENSNTRFAAPGKGANFTLMECTPGKGANFTLMECTPGKGANFTATECTPGKGANFTAMECTSEKNPNEIAVVTKTGESSTFSEDITSKVIKASEGVDERVVYIEEDEVVGASTVMVKIMEIELKNYEDYKIISLYIYNNNIIISLYNNIDFLLLITKLSNNQLIILYYSFNELFIEYNNFGNLDNNLGGNLGNLGENSENNGNLGNLEENSDNLGNSEVDVENLEINYFLFEKWNILLIYSNKSISTLLITNNINLINYNTTPGKGANSMVTECTMGKGANDTFGTMGKGANSMVTECTSEKNSNEIAVVTKTGESDTFSEDINTEYTVGTTVKGATGTDGTTGRGPHTVTEEYIIIKLYEGYNIESIEYEDYIKLILLYTNYENEIYRKNSLADTPTIKNPNVIFTLQNSNSLSIYFIDIYFGYNFTDYILRPSVTVLGPTESITPGKGANLPINSVTTKDIDTIGASTVTEEKNLNEIAVVTKTGESDTFSIDTNTEYTVGTSGKGATGTVGPSTVTDTVTEKLKYLYKNNVYKENIKLYESLLNILYNFDINTENFDNFVSLDSTVENVEIMESVEISVENVDNTVENISLNKINEYIIIIKNLLNIQNNFNYILENNIKPVTVTSTMGKGANDTFSTMGKRANITNTNTLTTTTIGASTVTMGKGANFMGMECTTGKGANDTFGTTGKGTRSGGLLVGEPHSVTEELKKLVNKNINIKIEINEIKKLEEIIFYINQQLNILYKKLYNIPLRCLVTTNNTSNKGKGANDTFNDPGKRANNTFTTQGKGANSTLMECTSEKNINEIAVVTNFGESSTFTKDISKTPYGAATEETGTVGPGCRGTDTVTEELNEKLYNLINDIKLLYNKPLKINNNIKLYKFTTLFNSSVTVLAPTNSNGPEVTTGTNNTTKDTIGASTVTEENSTVIAAPKDGTTVLTGPLGTRFETQSSTTTGKGANFMGTECTMGKGANSTATECTIGPSTVTEEKNTNEIAVVTKSGESSNNIDRVSGVNTGVISTGAITNGTTNTKETPFGYKETPFGDKVAPFGASTDGTTDRGPHTVTENIFGNMELNKELNNPILFNTQITQTKQLNNISIFSTFNNYQSLYDLANQFNTVTGTNTGFSNTNTGFSNTSTGFTGGFGNTVGNTSTGFTGGFTGTNTGFGNTSTGFTGGFTGFTGGFSNTKETPFGSVTTSKEVPFGTTGTTSKESPFGAVTTSKESPFGTTGTTTDGVVGRGPDTVTENIWTGIRKYDPLN